MTGVRSVRGNVNAILNGMVRDGLITSFETNFDSPLSAPFALHVRVAASYLGAGTAYDERRRELQDRIMRQLEPFVPGVIVSVRAAQGTTAPKATAPPTNGEITGERCRAARRLLGWSMHEHAHVAGVGVHALGNFERGEAVPRRATRAAIIGALEAAGVTFGDGDVRLMPEALKRKRS